MNSCEKCCKNLCFPWQLFIVNLNRRICVTLFIITTRVIRKVSDLKIAALVYKNKWISLFICWQLLTKVSAVLGAQLLCNSRLSELKWVFLWKWTKSSIELSLNICFWKAIRLRKSKISWFLYMGTLHHYLPQLNFGQLNLNMAVRAWETMNVRDVEKLQLPTKTSPKFTKWC